MARIVQQGPLTVAYALRETPWIEPLKEAPPGTLAVSAQYQDVDPRMLNTGFVRMVVWRRPNTGEVLTLWRKPGLKMPKKGMSQPPKWEKCSDINNGSWYNQCELFSCCGTIGQNYSYGYGYEDDELAGILLSIKKPPHDPKENPVIRIWEGKYHSKKFKTGETIFNRRVRVWIRLPYGCNYTIHDTRLI